MDRLCGDPKGARARSVDLAYLFINFVLRLDISVMISNYTWYRLSLEGRL